MFVQIDEFLVFFVHACKMLQYIIKGHLLELEQVEVVGKFPQLYTRFNSQLVDYVRGGEFNNGLDSVIVGDDWIFELFENTLRGCSGHL